MKKAIAALIVCLLLTGCWDEVELKKLLFVDVIGLDYKDDSKLLKVDYVISSLKEAHQGGGKASNTYISSTGRNIYDAVASTNKELPGVLSVLETRLYLISTNFAKDQPLNYLNITSQFQTNPLYGHLAMYDGNLSELLAKKNIKEQTVSEFLVGLLDDERERGRIPSNKLLHYILGGSEFVNDFALNRFEPSDDGARLAGTGLFSDGKYTGVNLNDEDTLLVCLLNGTGGRAQPIFGNQGNQPYTALVRNAKRNLHMTWNKDGLREKTAFAKLKSR